MKTISLTDEAYLRLLAWKNQPRDSFSNVVLRVVPPKYSGAALAEAAQHLPPLSKERELAIRESVVAANDWARARDPWPT